MASAALTGFVEGFAGTLATNILERKREARDYFNKQVEYARTTGLENRKKAKQMADSNMSIASQLQAVGVPKEIIMAQVEMNPQGLSDFYGQAEKIRASTGKDFTEEEWRAVFEVSKDYKAPDEDLSTFISRIYDPLANAASQPDFEDDPRGSLISSMMGYSAMDEANSRLKTTMIAEGLSADDLIRYGDTKPQRNTSTTVTTNYEKLNRVGGGQGGLSISEASQLNKIITDTGETLLNDVMRQHQLDTGKPLEKGGDVTSVRDDLLDKMMSLNVDGVTPATALPLIERFLTSQGFTFRPYGEEEEIEETVLDDPSEVPEGVSEGQLELPLDATPPEAVTDPVEAPVEDTPKEEMAEADAPINPHEEPRLWNLPPVQANGKTYRLSFSNDNGDGTSDWVDESGEVWTLKNRDVRSR